MARIWADFCTGTFTGSNIAASATTLSSAQFANLPVVAAPNTLTIIGDPGGLTGSPEKMTVTSHTSGATTVTVTRASDGTQTTGSQGLTAREFNVGANLDRWEHGPTSMDLSTINTQVTTNTANIATLTTTSATATSDISSLTTAESNDATNISSLLSSVATLQGDLTSADSSITGLSIFNTSRDAAKAYAQVGGALGTGVQVVATNYESFTNGSTKVSGGGIVAGSTGWYLIIAQLPAGGSGIGPGYWAEAHTMVNGSSTAAGGRGSSGNTGGVVSSVAVDLAQVTQGQTINLGGVALSTAGTTQPSGTGSNCYILAVRIF